jgi:hypothetical protein
MSFCLIASFARAPPAQISVVGINEEKWISLPSKEATP